MKFSQYINKSKKPKHLPLEIEGEAFEDVYFRRLNAGEGLELKDSLAELIAASGDKLKEAATDGDVAKAEESVKKSLNADQMRAMFRQQALFTFLHFADKDGNRVYTDRKEFDKEVPEDFIQAFYAEGSKLKGEPDEAQAEKNSSTPTD